MSVHMTGQSVGATGMRLRHGPSGAELVTAAPVDNGGDGSSFSPTDLCAVSLGACASTIVRLYAARAGISLAGVRFEVDKEMSAAPPRRIARLTVTYWFDTTCDATDFTKLERAARTCPVRLTLGPDVEVVEQFQRETAA